MFPSGRSGMVLEENWRSRNGAPRGDFLFRESENLKKRGPQCMSSLLTDPGCQFLFVCWSILTSLVRNTPPLSKRNFDLESLFTLLKRYLMTTSNVKAGGFIRSRAGVEHPDIQFHFLPSQVCRVCHPGHLIIP